MNAKTFIFGNLSLIAIGGIVAHEVYTMSRSSEKQKPARKEEKESRFLKNWKIELNEQIMLEKSKGIKWLFCFSPNPNEKTNQRILSENLLCNRRVVL